MSVHFINKLLALGACAVIVCSAAQAADDTRYISVTGNNANACTLAAPCRTLQKAINVTPNGGEIQILDSGFFGNNATIRKSLTISGNGHTVYLGTPITINKAGAVVAIRRLVLNGQGTVTDGIAINEAAAVHIERCVIHGYSDDGVAAIATGVQVFVTDSISRNNGGVGLVVFTASRLTVDNSRFENNGAHGIQVSSGLAAINRSTASGNSLDGLHFPGSGIVTVESSVVHGNGDDGMEVGIGTLARISNITVTENNDVGIRNNGTVETLNNSIIRGQVPNIIGPFISISGR